RRIREFEEEYAAAKRVADDLTAELKKLVDESNAFSQGFYSARRDMESAQEEMMRVKNELNSLQAEVSKQNELIRLKEAELHRLKKGELTDFAPQLAELEFSWKELDRELKQVNFESMKFMGFERELMERIPKIEDSILDAREKIAESSTKLKSADAAGGRALEEVLNLRSKHKGIYGVVQELIRYDSKYAVPIGIAFGPRANFVVVDSIDTADKAIRHLKDNNLGRVSFIPLDQITPPAVPDNKRHLLDKKGAQTFILDLLKFDKKFKKAVEFVSTDTLLMDDLASAEKIVGEARIVTFDGELVEPSGLVTGGRARKLINPYQEAELLKEWGHKLDEFKLDKDKVIAELADLRERGGEVRKRKAELEVKQRGIEIELKHLKLAEAQMMEEQKDLRSAIKKLEQEIQDARKAVSDGDDGRSALIRKLSDLNVKMLESKQRIDLEKEQTFGTLVKEKEHKLSEMRITCSDLENKMNASRTQYSVYEKQFNSIDVQLRELDSESKNAREEQKKADDRIRGNKLVLRDKLEEQKKLSGSLKDFILQREKLDAAVSKFADEKSKLQFKLEKLSRDKQQLELRRVALETQLAEKKARLQEFIGVEILRNQREDDKPKFMVELKGLQSELEQLGPVNLRALEMFEEKAKEMLVQFERVEQLAAEREAVLNLITEVESKKGRAFMDVFNQVNQNFKQLFRQIFRGHGTLYLENPESPLEGGLTIQVQLENKEIKYLELMSGGEKSLIALVFLFAIQSVNPSSIYILDEADAALDADNSKKLSRLLAELSKQTQFMVVSHNEAVYKHANCLVGVAMAGREGSKLVEVKLSEAGEAH
ncbi:MAG: hypothetical protein V1834_04360, partial [Candidatus Micrarchaeota archaeon]